MRRPPPPIARVNPHGTRSEAGPAVPVETRLIELKIADARRNPRGREIHAFHSGAGDPLQRMLNALQPGTYVRPHRHTLPPRPETFVVLRGAIGLLTFDDGGAPDWDGSLLAAAAGEVLGADIRPAVWHAFFALEPDTVIFEAKPGPYDSATDKEFAPWAPEESAERARGWLATLEDEFRRAFRLPARGWTP